MEVSSQEMLRRLPGVDRLLQVDVVREALARHPRRLVLESVRLVVKSKRREILDDPAGASGVNLEVSHLVDLVLEQIEALERYTLRNVVNATGIVIHTNLGRSLLPEEAVVRLGEICRGYNNLEYDLEKGRRGSRYVHAEAVLCELTGSEAALVVNNNAGAVFLVLNTLAADREVIVSRGQLVEIGGSFRIPDVMRASGAFLREVGCTNRTHLHDYASVINERTALIMKVHSSNYRMVGFTSEVPLEGLVALGREKGIPVVEDLGSGSFLDFEPYGLKGEPTVQGAVQAGADLVTFSGDKLLGGPQAGIIVGRQDLVDRCRKNPLTRALRVDKMTLGALEATLHLYRDEREALKKVPTLCMIAVSVESLRDRAEGLAALLREADPRKDFEIAVQPCFSQVGGGSLPGQDLDSFAVVLSSPGLSTREIEAALRNNQPPIIARIESDRVLMDVRTLQEQDHAIIKKAFEGIKPQANTGKRGQTL